MTTTSASTTTSITSAAASLSSTDSLAELRLIPEFGGSPSESIVEWLERVELVCNLRGLSKPETVIPLRLTGGAFAVYQELSPSDKRDPAKVKGALITSFGTDSFAAYEQFVARRLLPHESVDVFLAHLRQLATQFGGVSERALTCAFVAGLPDEVRQTLRASSRMESLTLVEILSRARAIMVDGHLPAAAAARLTSSRRGVGPPRLCYECHQPNHLARDCFLRRRGISGDGRAKGGRRCFRCDSPHHLAADCPGKANGERSAPASSPPQ